MYPSSYPVGSAPPPTYGYPPQAAGGYYPTTYPATGYAPQPTAYPPQPASYPGQPAAYNSGYPQHGYGGYPQQGYPPAGYPPAQGYPASYGYPQAAYPPQPHPGRIPSDLSYMHAVFYHYYVFSIYCMN
jgi:hypothetical protein